MRKGDGRMTRRAGVWTRFLVVLACAVTVATAALADEGGSPAATLVSTPAQMAAAVPASTDLPAEITIDPESTTASELKTLGLTDEEAVEAKGGDVAAAAQTIADALEDSKTADATVTDDNTVQVTYPFALQRIAVVGAGADVDTTGASAAAYDQTTDSCVMTFVVVNSLKTIKIGKDKTNILDNFLVSSSHAVYLVVHLISVKNSGKHIHRT